MTSTFTTAISGSAWMNVGPVSQVTGASASDQP